MADSPSRIVVAGDWHGSTTWATGVIDMLPDLLPDESPRQLVHLGDFGVWPGSAGRHYLDAVDTALQRVDGRLWFVDGNHEDHGRLTRMANAGGHRHRHWVRDGIWWLPRGFRWTWHDRTWLALGGATSVDRPSRTPGVDWWPEEALTLADCERAATGPAEVMVCHDAPASVPIDLPRPPSWWEMGSAEKHRELLQSVVDEVRPSWLMHGHYHVVHDTTVTMGHGEVQVTGLAAEGALAGNFRVLDVRTMAWEAP